MRCQEAMVEMSAALDGELDAAGASSLQEHLATCAPCRAQQEQLEALDPLLRAPGLRAVSVPEELRGRIASQIARPLPPPRRRASPLAFAVAFTGAAAAAAAIAMAGPTSDLETTDATAAGENAGDNAGDNAGGQDPTASLPAADPDLGAGASLARALSKAPAHARNTLGRHDCRLAVAGHSPVARACGSGGTAAARRVMRGLVESARARGVRFECRDCHRNEIDFQLDDDARERFASMLAVVGA
jgi:hypothetical protein